MCVGVVKTWVILPSVPQCFPCRNTSVSQRAAAKPLCLLQQEQAEQHGGGSTPQAPQAQHPEPTPAGCQQLRGCSQTGAGASAGLRTKPPPLQPLCVTGGEVCFWLLPAFLHYVVFPKEMPASYTPLIFIEMQCCKYELEGFMR